MVVDTHNAKQLIDQLSQAGATRIIFQYEQYPEEQSIAMAKYIKDQGMQVGICLAPDTEINDSIQLLLSQKYHLLNRKWINVPVQSKELLKPLLTIKIESKAN